MLELFGQLWAENKPFASFGSFEGYRGESWKLVLLCDFDDFMGHAAVLECVVDGSPLWIG